MTHSVVVIGGGIVGASAAWHLTMAGHHVVLIDRQDSGRATSAGAGIVAPGTSLRDLPAFYDLGKPAVAYYPELVAALADDDAGETGYAVCGKLFLAEDESQVDRLHATYELFGRRRDDGMPNLGAMQLIDGAAAKERFPALAEIPEAIWIPDAARVDGAKMRDALTRSALRHGLTHVVASAMPEYDGNRIIAFAANGQRYEADAYVIAGGAWSNDAFAATGVHLALAPQKGQILHVDMPGQDTGAWPILSWFGDQYMLAFGPHRVVAGATREVGSGFDTRVTPAGVKHVLDTALRIAPGIGNGTLVEVRVGLRPFTDDGIPFIDRLPEQDNVVVCTGHGPSGLQLGPYSGRLAAEMATGSEPTSDVSAFRISRDIVAP